jgi:hypothetical protein
MIRKILLLMLCFFSMSAFAETDVISQYTTTTSATCEASTSTKDTFCATFAPAAICYCNSQPGTTPYYCSGNGTGQLNNIWSGMMTRYHNLATACASQHSTTPEECIAEWKCYWNGGNSSNPPDQDHTLCNADGRACTTQKPQPPIS